MIVLPMILFSSSPTPPSTISAFSPRGLTWPGCVPSVAD
ncbi:hypothetical protein EVA_10044 [gut metagenome]|uniref:Uncharacterized protein n=1 Tax=gut metagenome TaxID=749906 RepID=J9G4Q8_9ZZZZ